MAADVPESGIGTTTSALTGCSIARLPAEFFSEFVNVFAEYGAVWLCEIDMLEKAVCGLDSARLYEEPAGDACLSSVTISPGSTSRMNLASMASSAQVSLATTYAPASVLPMHRGRMP